MTAEERRSAKFGVGSLASYDSLDQVGEGAYGYVFKGRDVRTGETVALKRLILHKEISGFPLCAVREIKFLKTLNHRNIVGLRDVVVSKGCEHKELQVRARSTSSKEQPPSAKEPEDDEGMDVFRLCGNLYFVFEFVDHDLGGLIDMKYKFSELEVKSVMKQLFEALSYLHDRKIVHRDIKPSNILISNRHEVKLADFGLARSFQGFDGRDQRRDMSNNVITLWYRPPELLLGATRYSTAVDIWSAGCVLAELQIGRPLFPGKTEAEELDLILRVIGTPSPQSWSGLRELPLYDSLLRPLQSYANSLKFTYASKLSEHALSLLDRILVADPLKRASAQIILSNRFFSTHPVPPEDPASMSPLAVSEGECFHEFKTKQARKRKEEELKRSTTEASLEPTNIGEEGMMKGTSQSEKKRRLDVK